MEFETFMELMGFVGINPDFIEELLPPKDAPAYITSGDNILIKNGKIEKLRGTNYLNDVTTQLGSSGKRYVLGMPIYKKYDGTKYLMAITPSDPYYLLSDTTWTDLGNITDGVNGSTLSWTNIDNKFVFTLSDSGYVYYWDGATFDTLLTPATLKARYLLEYKTRLILLRTIESGTEHYQRMKYSDAGAITTFDPASYLDLESEGVIRGGRQLEDEIIVYLDNSIHRIFWVDATFGFGSSPVSEGLGLLAQKTLCGNKDVHFFLAKEGLMKHRRGTTPASISKGKFDALILDNIDPVNYTEAVAYYYPHLSQLFLSYPSSGSSVNDTQLIIDTTTEEMISQKTLTGESYSSYSEFEKDLSGLSPDDRKNYGLSFVPIMGDKDGYVYEQRIAGYQDLSTSYESTITFPPTFFRDKKRNKRLTQVDLFIEKLTDQDISFVMYITNNMNETYSYNYTLAGTGDEGIWRYEVRDSDGSGIDIFGKEFRIKIKDSGNPYGWKFHGMLCKGYYSTVK